MNALEMNIDTVANVIDIAVAGPFIVCMIMLGPAFSSFLLEVLISIRTLRSSLVHTETFHQTEHEPTSSVRNS